jgi:hypothetical protein
VGKERRKRRKSRKKCVVVRRSENVKRPRPVKPIEREREGV